jgi:methyl-accepting chemotaxis protein
VAEEVRNLASKSQDAAKNTTDLIEGAIENVNNGSKNADSTSEALITIVSDTREVSEIISNISSSAREQADSITAISDSVRQINEVVQTNTAVSEEFAAAAQELNSQAERLKELVSFFRLSEAHKTYVISA